MKIYIATSWKNPTYEGLRDALKADGHDVYDFKDPKNAFNWRDIHAEDPASWSPEQGSSALNHYLARAGFEADFNHLQDADLLILCLPAGNSSHLEAGFARGQRTAVWSFVDQAVQKLQPELMWKMFGYPETCFRTLPALCARARSYAQVLRSRGRGEGQ